MRLSAIAIAIVVPGCCLAQTDLAKGLEDIQIFQGPIRVRDALRHCRASESATAEETELKRRTLSETYLEASFDRIAQSEDNDSDCGPKW